MNTLKYSFFLLLSFSLIGCGQNSREDHSKISSKDSISPNDDTFKQFQSNFEVMSIDNIDELEMKFNDKYLANDDSLNEVLPIYRERFLKGINSEHIYYGFKTNLPNQSIILTFLIHSGINDNIVESDDEIVDTTFYVSRVYKPSGEFQSSFRSFGSNLLENPPTYNMRSTFKRKDMGLFITNYEYSIGKSYFEAIPISDDDDDNEIYLADLIKTEYFLNYKNDKILLQKQNKSKVKVMEFYRNPLPVYLKQID